MCGNVVQHCLFEHEPTTEVLVKNLLHRDNVDIHPCDIDAPGILTPLLMNGFTMTITSVHAQFEDDRIQVRVFGHSASEIQRRVSQCTMFPMCTFAIETFRLTSSVES